MKSRNRIVARRNLAGTTILLAGGVLVATLSCSTVAQAQGGLFEFLSRSFGRSASPGFSYRPEEERSYARPARQAHRWQRRRRDVSEHARTQPSPSRFRLSRMGEMTPLPRGLGNRTVCVRTCDGFAFPVGRLARGTDLPVHEAACQAACPGAETQLYTISGRNDGDPSRARSAKDGSLYRDLATAFLFRRQLAGSCSCHGPDNMSAPLPITEDRTLRRGDVVVDAHGTGTVFDGSGDAPHSPSSFAEFRHSDALGLADRKRVDRLLDVSRREAVARDYERAVRVRAAGLQPVPAPAGSGAGVQAFRVVTASASFGAVQVRQVAPTIIVVR